MNSPPTWRYRICLRLVSPLLLIHGIVRSLRDGGWQYATDRLGFVQHDSKPRIHVHAASVGEVITVLPLLEQMQSRFADLAFLVTTNTPTGAQVLSSRANGDVSHAYLPIDFSGATRRFFKRKNITDIWVVETEIWPWLYARAKQRDLPITLINGRLGQRSRAGLATFFDDSYAHALVDVIVLARSAEDANHFVDRGAAIDKVINMGNLKLAATAKTVNPERLIDVPYMLAASTHDDEELLLAQAWLNSSSDGLLVIAPRHVERGARIGKSLAALQAEIVPDLPSPALRSLDQKPTSSCRLYIADTLGELHHWYAYASAAFVGGSLIQRGGHNVLEPARTNTLIIVGPHTFNFEEEVRTLRTANAIAIAKNVDEVMNYFSLASTNPEWANTLSHNAFSIINEKCEVLDAYCESLRMLMTNR